MNKNNSTRLNQNHNRNVKTKISNYAVYKSETSTFKVNRRYLTANKKQGKSASSVFEMGKSKYELYEHEMELLPKLEWSSNTIHLQDLNPNDNLLKGRNELFANFNNSKMQLDEPNLNNFLSVNSACSCAEFIINNNINKGKEISEGQIRMFQFNDLIDTTTNVFGKMNTTAVGISLEIIKRMDEQLWDCVREMYEKLKLNDDVRFEEIFTLVNKILIELYGKKELMNILKEYNKDLTRSIIQVSKLILSGYHEAYEIVMNTINNEQNNKKDNHCFLELKKTIKSEELNCDKKLPIKKINKRKCYACEYNTEKELNKKKSITFLKNKIENKNIVKNLTPLKINKSLTKTSTFSKNGTLNTLAKSLTFENSHFSKDLEKNKLKINNYTFSNNMENFEIYNNNKRNEKSFEILSIFQKNKNNYRKKFRSNLTISNADVKEEISNEQFSNNNEERVTASSASLFTSLSTALRFVIPYLPSILKNFLPNVILVILFSIYSDSLFGESKYFFGIGWWLKNKLRALLLGAFSLMDV